MTRIWIAATAATCFFTAFSGAARAQQPSPTPTAIATPQPTPRPWVEVPPSTTRMAATVPAAAAAGDTIYRPQGRSLGIGAGYTLPADLGTPNTVSARFRMASGLTFEPIIGFGVDSDSAKVDTAKTSATALDVFAGTAIRKPIASRNQVEALLIVSGEFTFTSASTKAGTAKTSSAGLGVGADWGVGVEFFPRSHWSISFDATNPIIDVVNTTAKDAADVETTITSISAGARFDPTVRLMTHLYY